MSDKTSFSCGEYLDITQVSNLYGRLQKSLQKSVNIELKADKVNKADTAGLQMFVALKREISTTDGNLIWKNPSEGLINSAKLLGLAEELGLE
ncbi:STAS domain-containing protein [Sessilibacter corallicola]|uniref:MlaB-like STAS domain-containing protein n=1 Tax=Sessilibacter corallicola TaxID=2904075 RepID=A0ABQ0AC39_9GAMM|nr:STAS domain-containing protein [Sessilibacter corallicola]MCE2027260.1 STAS domain-containing protein [Sessilibacter corallicola]